MYLRALQGYEKTLGAEHTSTLDAVNNLGNLYADQGKMAEAEAMHLRALQGKEKALGAEHTSTLDTVYNLGVLYAYQGKVVEAEVEAKLIANTQTAHLTADAGGVYVACQGPTDPQTVPAPPQPNVMVGMGPGKRYVMHRLKWLPGQRGGRVLWLLG